MKRIATFLLLLPLVLLQADAASDSPGIAARASTAGEQIEIIDFTVSPLRPLVGDTVTIRVYFRNVTSAPLAKLDWRIVRNEEVLGIGAVENVPPSKRFFVMTTWVAAAGKHQFAGDIDFDNALGENEPARANNSRTLDITVGTGPAITSSAPFDARRAERAGARYSVRLDDSLYSRCSQSGVVLSPGTPAGATLSLRVRCAAPGGRITLDAFSGFRLRNGWKISEISETVTLAEPAARWRWIKRPNRGSDDPSLVIEILSTGAEGEVAIAITIEGPDNKEPY